MVLIGLSDEAVPLLRRLADDLPRGTTLAVLVEDSDHPLTKLARNIWRPGRGLQSGQEQRDPDLVLRRNRFKVHALYVVSADVPANLAWARQFRDIADASRTAAATPPPRIIARIDDPWQAEYWRRTNAYRTPAGGRVGPVRWVTDALSIHEVTATMLMARVESEPHDRLAVVGRSPLALAICAELAQRERRGPSATQPRPSFSELMLVGPEANKLHGQHQIRQAPVGNSAESGVIDVDLVDPAEPALATLLPERAPAVIFADDLVGGPKGRPVGHLAGGAASELDDLPHRRRHSGAGLAANHGAALPVRADHRASGGAPVDSWERAARVVHQTYLLDLGKDLEPKLPAQRPWSDLSTFYRASNVRLVTPTLAGAEAVGRSWGPVPSEPLRRGDDLGPAGPLETVAPSWNTRRGCSSTKTIGGLTDPRATMRGGSTMPWCRWGPLPENYKKRAIGNVQENALTILYALSAIGRVPHC